MTFSLEQILTDPELKCPKGEVKVQLPKHLPNSIPNHFEAMRDLSLKLKRNNITYSYHGNGLFTIYSS